MLLTNSRALAGGIEENKSNGVLTPDHSFWVKTHPYLSRSFPPAKARGLVKSMSCFLSVTYQIMSGVLLNNPIFEHNFTLHFFTIPNLTTLITNNR